MIADWVCPIRCTHVDCCIEKRDVLPAIVTRVILADGSVYQADPVKQARHDAGVRAIEEAERIAEELAKPIDPVAALLADIARIVKPQG